MQILKLIAIAAVLALVIAGCRGGRQVLNVGEPVVTSKANPSADDVAKAIIRAGINTNWRITEAGPGMLMGVRTDRAHSATVNITYTTTNYTITLKESTLEREGTVHREYNRWVQQLSQQIRSQLGAI
jgi:hypothetical protein